MAWPDFNRAGFPPPWVICFRNRRKDYPVYGLFRFDTGKGRGYWLRWWQGFPDSRVIWNSGEPWQKVIPCRDDKVPQCFLHLLPAEWQMLPAHGNLPHPGIIDFFSWFREANKIGTILCGSYFICLECFATLSCFMVYIRIKVFCKYLNNIEFANLHL